MYKLLTTESEQEPLGCTISSMYYLATLEIVVSDASGLPYLAMMLGSYAIGSTVKEEHGEGYWVPPNVAYPVPYGYTAPMTHGSLRKKVSEWVDEARVRQDVEQMAYSFGLRDAEIERRGNFIEVKNSPRTPEVVRAFHVERFVLKSADAESLVNLADPEGRHGMVFLPLEGIESYVHRRPSPSHGRDEAWFLGKPLQSNVEHIAFNPAVLSQLRSGAIGIAQRLFVMEEQGLILVGDVAGYGAALQYAKHGMSAFTLTNDQIRQGFRSSVLNSLEDFASKMGTLQTQFAGDGVTAALPRRVHGGAGEVVPRLLRAWEDIVAELDGLNASIPEAHLKVGSRLALASGPYRFGRMGGLRSASPAFDGEEVIRAARLEQALNAATKSQAVCLDEDGLNGAALHRHAHYVVVDSDDSEVAAAMGGAINWCLVGSLQLGAKEFQSRGVVYKYSKQVPGEPEETRQGADGGAGRSWT